MLLNLNLPRCNGLEVSAEVRADVEITSIPIVMLTTSGAPEDILRTYQLHASAYVTKPADYGEFIGAVGSIDGFYFRLARFPGAPSN